ncbi:MAG: hypothetical protein MZU91_00180 [Desulfosudis oleivorans]|nr:hypothetical protein [Desulfosudis oleivorans]
MPSGRPFWSHEKTSWGQDMIVGRLRCWFTDGQGGHHDRQRGLRPGSHPGHVPA